MVRERGDEAIARQALPPESDGVPRRIPPFASGDFLVDAAPGRHFAAIQAYVTRPACAEYMFHRPAACLGMTRFGGADREQNKF
jgi:hypothetical protein